MTSAVREQIAERRFVENLRPRFENDGFTFEAYPVAAQLPEFLGRYRPDAIARKGPLNIAIEVKSRQSSRTEPDLRQIRQLFENHADWQLRVVFRSDDLQDGVTIASSTPAMIRERMTNVNELLDQKQQTAAFLAAWSLLEASFRSVRGTSDSRPYDPGTVVQSLAMEGKITPEMELQIRDLLVLRSKVVHGDLGAAPTDDQVSLLLSAIDSTLSEDAP